MVDLENDEDFQEMLEELRQRCGAFACSVGIVHADGVRCFNRGGRHHPAREIDLGRSYRRHFQESTNDDVDRHTMFKIGALSETLTALVVCALVKHEILTWETPISRYLPELGTSIPVVLPDDEIMQRLTFTPSPNSGKPMGKLTYWDQQSLRDLVTHKCHRLPPTDVGYGLHEWPILERPGLIRTVKYFTSDKAFLDSEPSRSEKTAFSYALIGSLLQTLGGPDTSKEEVWYAFLKTWLLKVCMSQGTTCRTEDMAQTNNVVLPRRLVSDVEGADEVMVDTNRWAMDEKDVFTPAVGIWSNMEDMMGLCAWILRSPKHKREDREDIFGPTEPGDRFSLSTDYANIGLSLRRTILRFPSVAESGPIEHEDERQFSLRRERSDGGVLGVRVYESMSKGSDHNNSITLLPEIDLAVIVLSGTGTRVPFAEIVTQYVLQKVAHLPSIDVLGLATAKRDLQRNWYHGRILKPWEEGRDLKGFFQRFGPVDCPNVAALLRETVGRYENVELRRSITLTAHPIQMGLFLKRGGEWKPSNLADSIETPRDAIWRDKTNDELATLARMCQMSMAIGQDLDHQKITIVPYKATQGCEWWSFLPSTEKDAYVSGCGYVRRMEQSLVKIMRLMDEGEIPFLIVDIGGRSVRFTKVITDVQSASQYWNNRLRSDYKLVSPVFVRQETDHPLPPPQDRTRRTQLQHVLSLFPPPPSH